MELDIDIINILDKFEKALGNEVENSYNKVLESVNEFLGSLVISAVKHAEQIDVTIKHLVEDIKHEIIFSNIQENSKKVDTRKSH